MLLCVQLEPNFLSIAWDVLLVRSISCRCTMSQGRLLHWYPGSVETNKALPASYPDLIARFVKETALSKREMFPDLDHMDVTARQESLALRGDPILLQLPVVPSYALTVHKVQALSIKHEVVGCLEGVFAQGQVYVLVWHP